MPPRSPKRQKEAAEVAAFVSELYEASGLSSWGEFARESEVSAATMSDYKRGENAPSGYRLLKMIRAAGWPQAQAPLSDLEFRERVATLLREVQRLLPPEPDGQTAEGAET